MVASSPLALALRQPYTPPDPPPPPSPAPAGPCAPALRIGRWHDRPADAVRQWGAASRAEALESALRALTD